MDYCKLLMINNDCFQTGKWLSHSLNHPQTPSTRKEEVTWNYSSKVQMSP